VSAKTKQAKLDGVPLEGVPGMQSGPVNELGVVCLFALLSKRLGFAIRRVQAGFPDCIAQKRTANGWKTVRVEFEYNAKSFKAHGHNTRGCDYIVCWENDWPDAPKHLEILDLRRQVEPRRVWLQAVAPKFWDTLDKKKRPWWSLPRLAKKNDLVLFYHKTPRRGVRHVAIVAENAATNTRWRWGGYLRVLARLEHPVSLDHIRASAILKKAPCVSGNFQTRYDVTPWWSEWYRLITVLNPDLQKTLTKYFAV
jgi:hypothetical protein